METGMRSRTNSQPHYYINVSVGLPFKKITYSNGNNKDNCPENSSENKSTGTVVSKQGRRKCDISEPVWMDTWETRVSGRSKQPSLQTTLGLLCRKVSPPELLPCVARVSVVLCWPFPHAPAEWLFPLSGPPPLCITRHLWCPEVQGEIYQAVYASQRAEIQK